jgi:hypothetical protein
MGLIAKNAYEILFRAKLKVFKIEALEYQCNDFAVRREIKS